MNRLFDNLPLIRKYVSGKIVLSFLMLLLSIILFAMFNTFSKLICVFAMMFSFFGDFALNYHHKENSGKTRFILGGFFFAFAHLFYFVAYANKIHFHGFNYFNIGALLMILILKTMTIFFLRDNKSEIKSKLSIFALIYLWISGINYVTVSSYAFSIHSLESIALIGGLSFLVSDVIIGFERLAGLKSKVARELVWWLYPIGQIILITCA